MRGNDPATRHSIMMEEDHKKRYGLTPNRHLTGHRNMGGHSSAEQTDSDARLNKLINDYRMENERCTLKISELKQRLVEQQQVDSSGPDNLRSVNDKIYAKSFKAASDKLGGSRKKTEQRVPSYYHNSAGKGNRIWAMSALFSDENRDS